MSAIWHDIECGAYSADLPVWRALARRHAGPVLDVGAGTGRVALDLAERGHRVVALDLDEALLAELSRRADGHGIDTAVADARSFELGTRFGLIIVPMQTVQLLGAPRGAAGFSSAPAATLSRAACSRSRSARSSTCTRWTERPAARCPTSASSRACSTAANRRRCERIRGLRARAAPRDSRPRRAPNRRAGRDPDRRPERRRTRAGGRGGWARPRGSHGDPSHPGSCR